MRHSSSLVMLMLVWLAAGCGAPMQHEHGTLPHARDVGVRWEVVLESVQTLDGLGAAQGVYVEPDGRIFIYGDAETGIVREYVLERATNRVVATGRVVRLTVGSEDLMPHPTGLTRHAQHGTWMGDTVNRIGRIYRVDWDRALAQGTLDGAVEHAVLDDAAVNGTRPLFVRVGDRDLIATSDYGDVGNAVRLYDPAALARSRSTREEGVLVASHPCGPFVQSLHWIDEHNTLVLVQNITAGLGWRLTFASLDENGFVEVQRVDLDAATDELEGFAMLDEDRFIAVSAMRQDNVRVGRVRRIGGASKR